MLGLEKRIDAMRDMQGISGTESQSPAKSTATMGIMLALVAIVVAVGVYFAVDGKYAGKLSASEARLAAMEAKVAEAVNAPKEMARKAIAANNLDEMALKVNQLKGQLEAAQQEKLAKIDELVKSLQADIAK